MSKSSSSPNQGASTSKEENVGKVEIILIPATPSTPLIKRCRPMTDEMFLRAPSKEVRICFSLNLTFPKWILYLRFKKKYSIYFYQIFGIKYKFCLSITNIHTLFQRIARRSENFISTSSLSSICYPQTPRRQSDFQYRSKKSLFVNGIKE